MVRCLGMGQGSGSACAEDSDGRASLRAAYDAWMSKRITRLAPSPTGALHLGNARTFLINWAIARKQGWRIVVRVEDLDSPRVKAGADRGAMADLAWLGMDWDEGPYYQTADLTPYHDALAALKLDGLTYHCRCTRKEIEQAQSAPHGDEHEVRYPGICRDAGYEADGDRTAVRVRVPDELFTFDDVVMGAQSINVHQTVGDFVVASKAGLPAYQLAVVVDDARHGVTDVVRGDDLIRSTGRQMYLYRVLGLGNVPRWWHLPLVVGEDGRRLAKRHGDTRIAYYREQGVSADRVVGLIAFWSGMQDEREPMAASTFTDRFDLEHMPRHEVVFTEEDHLWLLAD